MLLVARLSLFLLSFPCVLIRERRFNHVRRFLFYSCKSQKGAKFETFGTKIAIVDRARLNARCLCDYSRLAEFPQTIIKLLNALRIINEPDGT